MPLDLEGSYLMQKLSQIYFKCAKGGDKTQNEKRHCELTTMLLMQAFGKYYAGKSRKCKQSSDKC